MIDQETHFFCRWLKHISWSIAIGKWSRFMQLSAVIYLLLVLNLHQIICNGGSIIYLPPVTLTAKRALSGRIWCRWARRRRSPISIHVLSRLLWENLMIRIKILCCGNDKWLGTVNTIPGVSSGLHAGSSCCVNLESAKEKIQGASS